MKKIILALSMLVASSFSYAQGVKNTDQRDSSDKGKSIYDVYNLELKDNVIDKQVSFNFILEHLNGIAWLRNHVLENLELYPMEEEAILSSRNTEHEAHKRWERYMRKLPVTILQLTDLEKVLKVESDFSSSFKPCEKFQDNVVFTFTNNSSELINAEIEFIPSYGITFPSNDKEIQVNKNDELVNFSYFSSGKATFNIPANGSFSVQIPVVYSCQGDQGNSYLTHHPNNEIDLQYQINFGGFIYNKNTKDLYRVFSPKISYKKIQL